jgi:hypothetical protein
MGCCCAKDQGEPELELTSVTNAAVTCKIGPCGKNVAVRMNDDMNAFEIKGNGTALGSCPLDCDSARWEVIIGDGTVQLGVKRFNKKSPTSLEGTLLESEADQSTAWPLKDVELRSGDVVGIYWDQTDLPMLSFSLNGNPIINAAINRVRPSSDVHAAVSVSNNGSCTVIFDENYFKHPSISSKFKMIICSTSLI